MPMVPVKGGGRTLLRGKLISGRQSLVLEQAFYSRYSPLFWSRRRDLSRCFRLTLAHRTLEPILFS